MTPGSQRSLITVLGRWIGVSTALSLAVFAAAAAAALLVVEAEEAEAEAAGEPEQDPLDEAVTQVGLAMLVAAPLGVGLAIAAARWLVRRTVARVTVVQDVATRMTADNLGERLPVSLAGDELDALATALNGLFARLADGVALQRQFAADASHELRSPLAVLSSTLEVARRRPRTVEELEAVVDRALQEVQHMTGLVEALLALARAGTVPRCEVMTAQALVAALLERFEVVATAAGVRLEAAGIPDVSVTVDRELMAVALGNVVANAIAHSPASGVVRVDALVDARDLVLRISDQGAGVAPEDRERIFHPFVRGAAVAADRSGARVGLGLGLAIARRVIEGHGARIRVDDAPGGGAAFSLHLPRSAHASAVR